MEGVYTSQSDESEARQHKKIIRTRFRWKCVDGELFRQEPYIYFGFGCHYDFVHQPPVHGFAAYSRDGAPES
jgi:hypothetical protein